MTDVSPNTPATQDDDTVWPEHDTKDTPDNDPNEKPDAGDLDTLIVRDTGVLGDPD